MTSAVSVLIITSGRAGAGTRSCAAALDEASATKRATMKVLCIRTIFRGPRGNFRALAHRGHLACKMRIASLFSPLYAGPTMAENKNESSSAFFRRTQPGFVDWKPPTEEEKALEVKA